MDPAENQNLHDAVARNLPAVLSLPSAGACYPVPTRLLLDTPEGFWVAAADDRRALLDELLAAATPVGVAFRHETTKVIFTTRILRRDDKLQIGPEMTVHAVLLAWPDKLKSVQRRSAYRVHHPEQSGLVVRIWRMAPRAQLQDRPLSTAEMAVEVHDLSATGIGLQLKESTVKLVADERLRIDLRLEETAILLEGRLKQTRTLPNGSLHLGVQFCQRDDIQSRKAQAQLGILVGQLQREEVRRQRLNLSA